MPSPTPSIVLAPGGFVSCIALGFGSLESPARQVDTTNPLPVTMQSAAAAAATSTPLAGIDTTTGTYDFGPFVPQLARAIWLTLSGTWIGTAQLLLSTDGGAIKLALTVAGTAWGGFTTTCNEPVAEKSAAAATYFLRIALTSGSVTYRVGQ